MHNWRFTKHPVYGTVEADCSCCQMPMRNTAGFFEDEGGHVVVSYWALLTSHSGTRRASVCLGLKDGSEGNDFAAWADLDLRKENGAITSSVATNCEGQRAATEKALAGPHGALLLAIKDLMIEHDKHIRPWLDGNEKPIRRMRRRRRRTDCRAGSQP